MPKPKAGKLTRPTIFKQIDDMRDLVEPVLASGLDSGTAEIYDHLWRAAERVSNAEQKFRAFTEKHGDDVSDDALQLGNRLADGAFVLGLAVGMRLGGAR